MRNPWGKTIWKGEWSYESKKWTNELRDKYNYHNKPDDGSFYIAWPDFMTYFNSFVICRLDPTYIHTSATLKSIPHKSNYLRMTIAEDGNYNLSVYQVSKRKCKNIQGYEYSPTRLTVVKDLNGSMEYISSANKSASHCVSIEANLTKGIYIVAIKVEWGKQQIRPIVFNSYGVERVQIEQIGDAIAPVFKNELIKSYSQKYKGKIKQYTKINIPEAYSETEISIDRGIGYIRMKNPSKKWFQSNLHLPKCEGLKVIKPHKLPLIFNMDPGTQHLVGFWVSSKGYSYESQ